MATPDNGHTMDARYFTRVIPPRTGFSPYRSPGWGVQLPTMFMALYWGWRLCWWTPWLWPVILVYAIAGMCLGRDLAIAAHYDLFITLAIF